MSEIRKTDPNTGGMKGEKIEQLSLVSPDLREKGIAGWPCGPRKHAALRMLDFECGDDEAIIDVYQYTWDALVAHYGLELTAVLSLARQYGFGSRKYARGNWRKGYAWSLSIDAFWRHLLAGYVTDPESGEPHMTAAMWHACCLRDFVFRKLGTDDRLYLPVISVSYPDPSEGFAEVKPLDTDSRPLEVKKEMDAALVRLFNVPFVGEPLVPTTRIFTVGPDGTCTPLIEQLASCEGCPDREECEAEAGL